MNDRTGWLSDSFAFFIGNVSAIAVVAIALAAIGSDGGRSQTRASGNPAASASRPALRAPHLRASQEHTACASPDFSHMNAASGL
jgi:hypothetical protein